MGNAFASVLGLPGNVLDLGIQAGGVIDSLVKGKGFVQNPYNQDIRNLNPFPTSSQLKQFNPELFDQHATGVLGFAEDVATTAAELAAINVPGKNALKAAAASESAKSIARGLGASETSQELIGLSAMALVSLKFPGQRKA